MTNPFEHGIDSGSEGEHWFASLVESVFDGVLVVDRDAVIRYANRAAGLIVGRDVESMIGRDALFFLHPEDQPAARERLGARLAEDPEAGFLQARVLRPDGSTRIIEIVGGILGDDEPAGLVITARDITKQKQAERQLEESEERFRSLLYHTPQIVYQMDLDGAVTDLNPTAIQLWGEPLDNVRGQHFIHLVHPDDQEAAVAAFQRAVGGEPSWYEIRISTPGGHTIHMRGVTVPLRIAGEIVGVAGVAEDVSAMVASHHALAESQQRMRHVLSVTPTVLYSLEVSGQDAIPTWISENATDVFGHAPGALQRQEQWLEQIHPDDRERALQGQDELRRDGRMDIDYRFRRADGTYTWIFDSARLLAGPDGDPDEIIGSWTDISARKRHEEALRASEQQLETILSQMPAMIWAVDRDLRLVFARGRGIDSLGVAETDVVGRDLGEVVGTLDPDAPPLHHHQLALGGQGSTYETRFMGRDLEVSVRPMRAADDSINGVIGMAVDVTERKALEEQLRDSQKMEAIGRLTGGVAHDFNNLLTAISGYTDLLIEGEERTEQDRADLEEIRKAADQAARLTQQLLAFSRRQMLQPEELDINNIVGEMSSMLRRIVGEDVRLETRLAADLPHVEVDRTRFEQVIVNLVVNARDAMPEGGALDIETALVEDTEPEPDSTGSLVRVTVRDTGMGIPDEVRAHLFEPFFTTKSVGKGTGLGLPTVLGIVQQSGGRVEYESTVGQGTAFHVLLPPTSASQAA